MPRIPGIHHKDAIRVFEKPGFVVKRQSGHIVMSNGKTRLIIPRSVSINSITMQFKGRRTYARSVQSPSVVA
ncbi:MAG: hypothetical protein BWY82_00174 [Verrucomicrobia bacterium ADurb.Bin474]|nr:MAG: hypothetical protein BWY82_00174 [Verrucomicrobia bacterium ADurb.Bin474]